MSNRPAINADTFTFGIELETIIPTNAPVSTGAYHAGVRVPNGPAFHGNFWKAERDSSIHAPHGYRAAEFISPVLHGAEGVQNVLDFVEFIRSMGGRVNATCGCHVHIGLTSVIGEDANDRRKRNTYLRKLAGVVNINAAAVYAQTGTRRDLNNYCRPLDEAIRNTLEHAAAEGRSLHAGSRYHILNTTNVEYRGTVEFRAFAGTLNTSKIMHHIWTCLFMAGFAAQLSRVPWNGNGWASMEGGEGEKALKGLWKKAGNQALVGPMKEHKRAMRRVAVEMARKFDARA